jgi:predicted molibdopterin-dependent oxidoreductase YjgC
MPERFTIEVDGREVEARAGWSVAAALLNAGIEAFRRSVSGEPRTPLCGMGTCSECRVTLDGRAHVRACLEPCRPGQRVSTRG